MTRTAATSPRWRSCFASAAVRRRHPPDVHMTDKSKAVVPIAGGGADIRQQQIQNSGSARATATTAHGHQRRERVNATMPAKEPIRFAHAAQNKALMFIAAPRHRFRPVLHTIRRAAIVQ